MGIMKSNTEIVKGKGEKCQPLLEANSVPGDLDQEDGIGCCGGTVHLVRISIGTGILLMPYTLKNLGYIMAAIVFLAAGIIYYHIAHMILHTEQQMRQQLKVRLSYVELTSQIFQSAPFPFNKCKSPVKYFMCVFYSIPTANTVYLIIMANSIQTLARFFDIRISTTLAASVLMIPLVIFCLFEKILKILIPFSSVANVFSILTAVAIVVISMVNKTESTTIRPFGDVAFIPKSLAMYCQVFSCTSLLFALKSDMAKPQKLTSSFGALNVAAFFVIVLHYSFGLSLYISHGEDVQKNILSNMKNENHLTHIINSLFSLTLFVTYILCFFARFNNVWTNSLKLKFKNEKWAFWAEYGIRIGYNLLSYLLAVAVPNFDLVSIFAGSLSFIIDIALPSMLVMLHKITNKEISFWLILKNVSVIGICLALFGYSISECVKQIIELYST